MTPRGRRPWVLLGWGAAAVVVAGWLTLVEIFWLPLRAGGVLVPVSVVAAVVGNLVLVEGAHRVSRSRVVAALPAVVWVVVALVASQQRAEGDVVIVGGGASGYVNLAFLLLGVVSAAVAAGRLFSGPRRRGGSGSGGAR